MCPIYFTDGVLTCRLAKLAASRLEMEWSRRGKTMKNIDFMFNSVWKKEKHIDLFWGPLRELHRCMFFFTLIWSTQRTVTEVNHSAGLSTSSTRCRLFWWPSFVKIWCRIRQSGKSPTKKKFRFGEVSYNSTNLSQFKKLGGGCVILSWPKVGRFAFE